ncbi:MULTISPECIES: ATP-binding cassette domain-containing protein [Bacillaceae]|uniref:methionine ABC transporter ATP-binding protein n=1 Tax=Bacillaceae TaxID=186817 RepID=UPI001E61AE4E|nr:MULTISPECIES: ATP-binding cassette domain-containing protein [Bacillaceae]MCE4049476.1 ATP-binding cassette domain-containing protein [Bacillus sp. Au-Bac7]MCM3029737.1 ATP-binding cassette domain-containing protein [Niallia sp. MER 6]MDL0437248.1 ATP-binding cassette domain-containing protein [Niallia sp. SS-2023]UPO87262.1 ATP-binding cassette domain-containing protein [Niallia sp. Man26]
MIELKNVYKTFIQKDNEVQALKNINLKVETGDIFGVIGFSGAGKSTLIRLVNLLERPTKGEVIVGGQSLLDLNSKQLRTAKKQIGMVFQHFNLLESKSVFDNIAIPLILQKRKKGEIRKRVMELLEFVGLADKEKAYPNELSGGQKQRVGIARALATNPSVLLCDEATSALDPQTTRSILRLLKRINEEYNITVMIITHEMAVIQEICNKVAVMEQGEIIEQGTVLDVFSNPAHHTTKSFVSTIVQHDLPASMKGKYKNEPGSRLVKLEFLGSEMAQPFLYELVTRFGVSPRILFANTVEIQEHLISTMTVTLSGEDEQIITALSYLKEQGIQVKEVAE